MPTYVYACDACGKQFEQFQSFKDEPLSVCRCGTAGRVRRVIQPAGVVFKGSGWYINDSRSTSSSTESGESASTGTSASSEKSTTRESSSTSSEA